jgi:hypothetical protein
LDESEQTVEKNDAKDDCRICPQIKHQLNKTSAQQDVN